MNHRADRLRRRAQAWLASGHLEAARQSLAEALSLDPEDEAHHLELALLEHRCGQYSSARARTLNTCQRPLPTAAAAVARMQALQAFHAHGEMLRLARALAHAAPGEVGDLSAIGLALQAAGHTGEARRLLHEALARAPDDPVLRTQSAMLDLEAGDLARARNQLDVLCASPTVVPTAHWLLASLAATDSERRSQAQRVRRLLGQAGADRGAESFLAFALHSLLEALGDHEGAWVALERGCAAKRSLLQFDEAEEDRLHADLQACTAAAHEHSGGTSMRSAAVPIFIVGFHRSGTSLLERMLEGHPAIAVGGESMRLSAALRSACDQAGLGVIDRELLKCAQTIDADAFRIDYIESHRWLFGERSHFTEKLPDNHRLIGLVQRLLPQARVLHLVRDPLDTCWSNLRELFAGDKAAYSYRQDELGRAYLRYLRLMAHWRQQLPGFVMDVRYEDLVKRPEATARTVLEFCGLPWHPDCVWVEQRTGPVRSASALQVREPIHARSLGRAHAASARLAALRNVLAHGDR